MKTLMKQVEPLSGRLSAGHQIEVGYFDQELAQFNSANTVLEEVWNDFPDLIALRCALHWDAFSSPGKRFSKPWTACPEEKKVPPELCEADAVTPQFPFNG